MGKYKYVNITRYKILYALLKSMYSKLHEILRILTHCIYLRVLTLINLQLSVTLIRVYYVFSAHRVGTQAPTVYVHYDIFLNYINMEKQILFVIDVAQ